MTHASTRDISMSRWDFGGPHLHPGAWHCPTCRVLALPQVDLLAPALSAWVVPRYPSAGRHDFALCVGVWVSEWSEWDWVSEWEQVCVSEIEWVSESKCVWVSEWVSESKWVSETACLPACLSKAAYHIDISLGKIDESLKFAPFYCHVQNYTKDVYFKIKVKDVKFSAFVVYLILWVRVSHHHWSSQLTKMANAQYNKFVIDSLLLCSLQLAIN